MNRIEDKVYLQIPIIPRQHTKPEETPLLDMGKAFDTVERNGLLIVLKTYYVDEQHILERLYLHVVRHGNVTEHDHSDIYVSRREGLAISADNKLKYIHFRQRETLENKKISMGGIFTKTLEQKVIRFKDQYFIVF